MIDQKNNKHKRDNWGIAARACSSQKSCVEGQSVLTKKSELFVMHSMHPGYTWKWATSQKKLQASCKVCELKIIFPEIPKPCLLCFIWTTTSGDFQSNIFLHLTNQWHHRTHIYHSTLESKGAQIQSLRATDEPGFLCIHTENASFSFLQDRHWLHLTSHAPLGETVSSW